MGDNLEVAKPPWIARDGLQKKLITQSRTMEEVKLTLNEKGHGAFRIMEDSKQLGEMVISIAGKNLTVYHTEVAPEAEGKGLAKLMLNAMVDYAGKNDLKVIPLCPYVHAQFKRHPDQYANIWNRAS